MAPSFAIALVFVGGAAAMSAPDPATNDPEFLVRKQMEITWDARALEYEPENIVGLHTSASEEPLCSHVDLRERRPNQKTPTFLELGRADARVEDEVTVLVGTLEHGHTFPGATTPWGLVQATPWTHGQGFDEWDTQSGFNDALPSPQFHGMAHSALSGAGTGELGELRLLPTHGSGEMWLERDSVKASPGIFAAKIGARGGDANIGVKSSATPHGAIHQFTFPDSNSRRLKVLLSPAPNSYWGFKLVEHSHRVTSDGRFEGCSESQVIGIGDALSYLCYVIDFGQAFKHPSAGLLQDPDVAFDFPSGSSGQMLVRVAISRTDIEHARKAFADEVEGKSFEDIATKAKDSWEKALGVIKVDIEPPARKRSFYTALYHTMIAPTLISDGDGSYRLQGKPPGAPFTPNHNHGQHVPLEKIDEGMPVRQASPDDGQYSTFSLWDTYRSLHPLLNLVHPEQSRKFGKSLMAFEDAWGYIPRFQLLASPTDMMEGDGGSVILATMARLHLIDEKEAYEVLNRTRRQPVDERKYLATMGYIPASEEHSVSKALEQAKADSCLSHLARDLGFLKDAEFFGSRAGSIGKYWDPQRGIFAPVENGLVLMEHGAESDVNTQTRAYTEGTARQYSWGAEGDVDKLVELRGGSENLACALDYFFEQAPEQTGQHDLTGGMHGMSQGNEITMHIPYLYSAVGYPSRTQAVVDRIVKSLYSDGPGGLPGNDDMGAQSAWLVFSLLGLYPASPCSGEYVLGRPFVNAAELSVKDGILKIKAHNQSDENMYVNRAQWQGKDIDLAKPLLTHDALSVGGLLEFWMAPDPAGPKAACPPAS